MVYNFFASVLFLFFSFSTTAPESTPVKAVTVASPLSETQTIYNAIKAHSATMPGMECFTIAYNGYNKLKALGKIKKDVLAVVDFSKSSNTKRLWIIDMATQTVVYNTLVAHGRNSGDEFANTFSNSNSSNMSSLGFYATGEIYMGKHGRSLRLDGLETTNNNARSRGVVMHAADYVSENFIKQHTRLGRSQGCPALPTELTAEVIDLLKDKSCLFIYHPTKTYKSAFAG